MRRHTIRPEHTPIVVVIITLDHHVAGVIEQARAQLSTELPGLDLRFHAATSFSNPWAAEACRNDIAEGDIIVANMLFIDEHIRAVLPALEQRHEECDAMVCMMSASEVMRMTRIGDFRMNGSKKGLSLLRKLRGKNSNNGKQGGAAQMAALRILPKILRIIPGKAQDMRAYFLALSYWLAGSTDNISDLLRSLVNRYADGPRRGLRGTLETQPPRQYPETGLYHPRLEARMTESLRDLPQPREIRGTVGLLVMRAYVLAGNTQHYDAVIEKLEARGLRVIPAFACGLDNRPAVEKFFMEKGRVLVDAVLSLTGFSLVGGPAFNDAKAAEEMLARLDVPYVTAQSLEFQNIEQWESSPVGLTPMESTMMVAIPELDGGTGPIVFGGRSSKDDTKMIGIDDRIERLAGRIDKLVTLRATQPADRNVAIVLFNFPPNGGATGTAAYLSVFSSLLGTLRAMAAEGYDVEVPATVDELRERILGGNAEQYGTDANVLVKIGVDDHVRHTPFLAEIERAWGPAPGKQLSNGSSLFVLGARFGRVVVGIQPTFGYEGDPMRLLFESTFAPTHAFAAFYRYLQQDFAAHAVLHFGTHGALEFMPGKQVGLSSRCWPDRLLGDMPNIYLYASNNPSEGTLARRRSAATLVSYLTPPVTHSGLYRELQSLRATLDRLRSLPPHDTEAMDLVPHIQAQAAALELAPAEPAWSTPRALELDVLTRELIELEQTLIPCGLHVLGEPMPAAARIDYLLAIAESDPAGPLPASTIEALVAGKKPKTALVAGGLRPSDATLALCESLARTNQFLAEDHELPALMRALDGRFIRPAPGGDLLRNPEVLPTGRNVHGFDPYAIPSDFAVRDGARQAAKLLEKHMAEGNALPRSVALVLWGSDNLKSGGGPIGQALALLGARPRFDGYGKLCGAQLISLEELGRPRIDVMMTLSGIFRDLLPLQMKLLAEAALLAASADEPLELNFVRAHALAYQAHEGCDFETASLRVFGNADGAYGANVNQMIDSGAWENEAELGEVFSRRKSFAFQANGVAVQQRTLFKSVLSQVDLAYQNLESVELGVTTIDHYYDTLGGIARAARTARGDGPALAVYIGDQTGSEERVRTLREQVALETRTRSLNPKWTEEMLRHGAEGVRQIEAQVSNTLGWSATTSQVESWVYRELTKTYLLDPEMRERLAELNPKASVKLANRLLEASDRRYWQPDAESLAALEDASDALEDRLEGVMSCVA